MARKQGTGRKKIDIKKIENKHHLKTTFTKRRKGLFKKADELCNFYGTNIAVFTFSPYGRAYGFSNPSEIDVINRFYAQYYGFEFCQESKIEEESGADRGFWWQKSPEDIEFDEIGNFIDSLLELKKNVIDRIEELQMRSRALINFFV